MMNNNPMMQSITLPHSIVYSNPRSSTAHFTDKELKSVHTLLDNHFKTKGNFNNLIHDQTFKQKLTHRVKSNDPFELISEALSTYIAIKQKEAEKIINEITEKKETIGAIKKYWGKVYAEGVLETIPDDPENPYECFYETPSEHKFVNVSKRIFSVPPDIWHKPQGTEFPNWEYCRVWGPQPPFRGYGPNYLGLEKMDAIVTTYCDKHMVSIRAREQEMKNSISMLSSARNELSDLRQNVVGYSES